MFRGKKGPLFFRISLHATMKETKKRISEVVSAEKTKTSVFKF